MAPPAPTIPTLKQNFLTNQTRLLSQPLQPSRPWRRANDDPANNNNNNDAALPEKALDDALFRLNHTLKQHARRVYAPQATRHVAEQIDKLYLSSGGGAGSGVDDAREGGDDGDAGWRNVGADYADAKVIASVPAAWASASEREAEAYPLEAKRYAELAGRVRELSARRREVEARVGRLRRMRALLAPFGSTGTGTEGVDAEAEAASGGGAVQENLVTRDGEVERELERMRMLLVRVGDKVGRLSGREEEEGGVEDEDLFGDGDAMIVDDVEVEERRKVEGLLDGML